MSYLPSQIIFNEIEQMNPSKVEWKYLDREHGLTEVSKSVQKWEKSEVLFKT